ncbi:MAG: glycosyltransferase family 4 protein [Opitutaceae bacterium]
MRILVISNLYPPHSIGGYEERCRQTSEVLRARGHELCVLTSHHGLPAPAVDEQGVRRLLRIHGFFGHPWLGLRQLYALEKHNHAAVRAAVAEFRPDIIHVWNLGGLNKALILTLHNLGVPTVYDISDHWIAQSLKADVWLRWWNGLNRSAAATAVGKVLKILGAKRWLARSAPFARWDEITFPRIYFCSDRLKQIAIGTGWPVQHGAVIHCGVRTAAFTKRTPSDRFSKMLWVGRLHDDKDPLTAIRALGRLADAGHDGLTLDLYGRGDDDYVAQLKAAVAELRLTERVAFKSTDAAGMRRVYADYDALLFTSAWEEPFALTPLEGMAAHLPVVSTLLGGSRELVRDGENALAYEARDDAGLADAIARLAADSALRRSLVETAAREVVERYDLEVVVSQIEAYLQATRDGHGAA